VSRRTPRAAREGFTLVEMVISIVIVTIVAGLLAATLRQGFAVYESASDRKLALQQARAVLLRAERELRQVRDRGALLSAGQRAVSLLTVADSTVGFNWSGTSGTPLYYARNGRSYVFCPAVDSFALDWSKGDGTAAAPLVAPDSTDVRYVGVYLRLARGGQKVALREGILLRNLRGS
jgi:prepilin-type N-terminal cleavage/methylation domain-containing protein